jgi:hypothetical protein
MSELLTVRDVAAVLKCGEDAVVRRFAKAPGVIDIGTPETRSRRQYRILRIPQDVVEQYLTKNSGRSTQIKVPEKAERRRRSPSWEDRAILNLAKAGLQNDVKDRKVYERIAKRARILAALVPENRWADIQWGDDDDEKC